MMTLPMTARGIKPAASTMPTAMDQNRKAHANPYIVVLTCVDKASEDKAMALLQAHTKRCVCKSKTVRSGRVELNLEVRLNDENTDFVNTLSALDGVESAVLVSYNGDYMG